MLKKINNYIIKLISKNFGWKLFSIIFAVIIWFIVMNVINPTEVQTYSVNVTLLNQDKLTEKGFSIMNIDDILNTRIDIKVKSTRPALDELTKNKKDIKATIDLHQFDILYPSDISEPVNVSVVPIIPTNYVFDYEIVNFMPGTIEIQLENIVEVDKNITVETTGDVMDGYIAAPPELSFDSVTVRGPASILKTIDSVKAEIDISEQFSNISKTVTPVVYDTDGNIVENVILYPQSVNVSVVINKYGQIPIEVPNTKGTPKQGFALSSVICQPEYVEIIGDDSKIAEIKSIKLPDIDITNLDSTKVFRFDASKYIKSNEISVKDKSKSQISVIATIVPNIKRTFQIPLSNFEIIGNNSNFEIILPEYISVELSATEEVLNSINESSLKGTINVSGLSEGQHTVSAKLELAENISAENTNVDINIVNNENTTEIISSETTTLENENQENTNYSSENRSDINNTVLE